VDLLFADDSGADGFDQYDMAFFADAAKQPKMPTRAAGTHHADFAADSVLVLKKIDRALDELEFEFILWLDRDQFAQVGAFVVANDYIRFNFYTFIGLAFVNHYLPCLCYQMLTLYASHSLLH
jgi:hypothetical protein